MLIQPTNTHSKCPFKNALVKSYSRLIYDKIHYVKLRRYLLTVVISIKEKTSIIERRLRSSCKFLIPIRNMKYAHKIEDCSNKQIGKSSCMVFESIVPECSFV